MHAYMHTCASTTTPTSYVVMTALEIFKPNIGVGFRCVPPLRGSGSSPLFRFFGSRATRFGVGTPFLTLSPTVPNYSIVIPRTPFKLLRLESLSTEVVILEEAVFHDLQAAEVSCNVDFGFWGRAGDIGVSIISHTD